MVLLTYVEEKQKLFSLKGNKKIKKKKIKNKACASLLRVCLKMKNAGGKIVEAIFMQLQVLNSAES